MSMHCALQKFISHLFHRRKRDYHQADIKVYRTLPKSIQQPFLPQYASKNHFSNTLIFETALSSTSPHLHRLSWHLKCLRLSQPHVLSIATHQPTATLFPLTHILILCTHIISSFMVYGHNFEGQLFLICSQNL
jgi:hypothetical protein